VSEPIFTPEAIAAANAKVERLQRELDITNADHIALWLEANDPYDSDAWLAVQIVEAFERAINLKSAELGALEPMVQRSIMASAKLGAWLSAALEDPNVCVEMKADIREWFSAGEPPLAQIARHRTQALADAAAEAEPVAWMYSNADDLTPCVSGERWREPEAQGWTETPLYTRPLADHRALVEALEACTLADCPPGLFTFNGTLCFKSEYTTTLENPHRYQCDAYVVESGEYFHGGAKSTAERAALIVTPTLAALKETDNG
jgi:hypothetical protein